MKKLYISTIAAALLFTVSCQSDFENSTEDIVVTSGEANFSKYVALGNSLTSGYRDGALYIDGQNESYPSMLAAQMKLAGGGEFKQPMMPNNTGGFVGLPGFGGKYTLKVVNGALSPEQSAAAAALDNISSAGPYQNMGVPGAKSFHLVAPGYGSAANLQIGAANPYFVRFATSATTSVLADAMAQKPTFFSLWIGANDILSYATNGGMNSSTVDNVTTYTPAVVQPATANPATYKANDITNPAVLQQAIKGILDGLKSVGSTKGAIGNIPDVTSIPYFTRIPYNTIALDAAKVQTLNASLYKLLNTVASSRFSLAKVGQNPVIIIDNTLSDLSQFYTAGFAASGIPATQAAFLGSAFGKARQAKEGELILLPASKVLGLDALTNAAPTATSQFIYGASFPLQDQFSLTSTEATNISTATTAYNSTIKGFADSYGLAFVDARAKMIELNSASGIQWDGVKYNATFVTGGAFSLDGVHPTGRGYGIIANEFLKAINTTYKSNLPMINPNSYSGVTFP